MITYTLDEVQDKITGKRGTVRRDRFENELQMDLIGLESNAGNVTIDISLLR